MRPVSIDADKPRIWLQHRPMHICCPHCNAAYEVGPLIRNAVLVCHRCHTEFRTDNEPLEQKKGEEARKESSHALPLLEHATVRQQPEQERAAEIDAPSTSEEAKEVERTEKRAESVTIPVPVFLEKKHKQTKKVSHKKGGGTSDSAEKKSLPAPTHAQTDDAADADIKELQTDSEESHPPEIEQQPIRKNVVIWPWLIAMLLIISLAGFWQKQDAWLDHPWIRSVLINIYLPLEVRSKDWLIIPASIQGNWLKRDDGSQVLTIQGRIENRLYSELPPPRILVKFFDDTGITESLEERIMPITEPPSMKQVKHAPFVMPEIDKLSVEAQGTRGFFLVVESLPERTADFTLAPVVD